jgi:hypothetical protein
MDKHRAARILVLAVLGSLGCRSGQNGRPANSPGAALPSCPSPTTPIPAYESDGNGAIDGAELSATLCHVGVFVYVSPDTNPPGQALLNLDSHSPSELQIPTGGTPGWPNGSLSIDSPSPGVYLSSGNQACGAMHYYFGAPLPPGTDCDGGAPPACPPNCAAVCTLNGECGPCTLNPPSVEYQAQAASSCYGAAQSVVGSWQISLTSVTPASGPGSGDSYLVHGSLTANIGGGSSGTSSATLSLAF